MDAPLAIAIKPGTASASTTLRDSYRHFGSLGRKELGGVVLSQTAFLGGEPALPAGYSA